MVVHAQNWMNCSATSHAKMLYTVAMIGTVPCVGMGMVGMGLGMGMCIEP